MQTGLAASYHKPRDRAQSCRIVGRRVRTARPEPGSATRNSGRDIRVRDLVADGRSGQSSPPSQSMTRCRAALIQQRAATERLNSCSKWLMVTSAANHDRGAAPHPCGRARSICADPFDALGVLAEPPLRYPDINATRIASKRTAPRSSPGASRRIRRQPLAEPSAILRSCSTMSSNFLRMRISRACIAKSA